MLIYCTVLTILTVLVLIHGRDLTLEDGHMKPFGSGRPNIEVEEFQHFPTPKQFFENYVLPMKPVIMRSAGRLSPAYNLWTDDYFLSLPVPDDNQVLVETKKKENRSQPTVDMNFKKFVKIYNNTEQYMVNPVPDFLRKDVLLPCPLQCPGLTEKLLVENIMWFSSGGTKSVVHTDAVDNINCLYRGEKELWLIDPSKYRDKVDIDRPEGSYSSVDVDSVDYTKFPGLAEVEFYHAHLKSGDCLFIPFKWVHQVRSYGSNLAVNVWWNHHHNSKISLDLCNEVCDANLRIGDTIFHGFQQVMESEGAVKDHFEGLVDMKKSIDFKLFTRSLIGNDLKYLEGRAEPSVYLTPVKEMFDVMDIDKDEQLTMSDIEKVTTEDWSVVQEKLHTFEKVIEQTLDSLGPPEDEDPQARIYQEPEPLEDVPPGHIPETKDEL